MKGLRSLVATTLALFLVFSFLGNSRSAPQPIRRSWQGTAGRGDTARAGAGSAGAGRLVQPRAARQARENRQSRRDPGRRCRRLTPAGLGTCGAEPRLTATVEHLPRAEPGSRVCRGASLHLGPEPEEGPLRPTASRKTQPKSQATNSWRGSSSAFGFLAETTRSWRRKL